MSSPSSPHDTDAHAADAHERDAAATSDAALVRYQQKWERRLLRLQRSYPARWRVPGLSDEEVRDALTLRLLEVVRGDRAAYAQYGNGGEWGLQVMRKHLSELRRSFRLGATPTDFSDDSAREREPDQEHQLMELQSEACRGLAAARAQSQLSRPQRRWLAAMKLAANGGGAFFKASQELNLSAAARVLQKNRSSAQRAYRELQAQFSRELQRLK